MSTITTIQSTDVISNSRTDINTNFSNLNTDKIETSVLDTDTTLAANSDSKVATQKAVKAYVDSGGILNASEIVRGLVEEATDAEVTAGTATGGTGAKLFITPAKLANASGETGVSKLVKTKSTGLLDTSIIPIPKTVKVNTTDTNFTSTTYAEHTTLKFTYTALKKYKVKIVLPFYNDQAEASKFKLETTQTITSCASFALGSDDDNNAIRFELYSATIASHTFNTAAAVALEGWVVWDIWFQAGASGGDFSLYYGKVSGSNQNTIEAGATLEYEEVN